MDAVSLLMAGWRLGPKESVRIKYEGGMGRKIFHSPRFTQRDVRGTIVLAKGDFDLAESVKTAAVQTDAFLQTLEDEGTLIQGDLGFSRHAWSDGSDWILHVEMCSEHGLGCDVGLIKKKLERRQGRFSRAWQRKMFPYGDFSYS